MLQLAWVHKEQTANVHLSASDARGRQDVKYVQECFTMPSTYV